MKRSIAAAFSIGAFSISALALTTCLVFSGGALAQEKLDKIIRVGSLGDQSGLYADIGGPGSVAAAQMAIEDSGLLAKGWKIDLISADHQNKPDVGVNVGKQWIDVEKVDVFVDLASSGVGLAIANLAKEKNVDPKTPVRDFRLRDRLSDLPFLHTAAVAILDALGLGRLARQIEASGAMQAIERLNLDGLLALWHPSAAN